MPATSILVADAMKFTRSAPVRIGHISEIDIFVTDQRRREPIVDICRNNGMSGSRSSERSGRPATSLPLD